MLGLIFGTIEGRNETANTLKKLQSREPPDNEMNTNNDDSAEMDESKSILLYPKYEPDFYQKQFFLTQACDELYTINSVDFKEQEKEDKNSIALIKKNVAAPSTSTSTKEKTPTEHAILIKRICKQLNVEEEKISFCADVMQHTIKDKNIKKDPRILVVEEDEMFTFIRKENDIHISKTFVCDTISNIKCVRNIPNKNKNDLRVQFRASKLDKNGKSDRKKTRIFETIGENAENELLKLHTALTKCQTFATSKIIKQRTLTPAPSRSKLEKEESLDHFSEKEIRIFFHNFKVPTTNNDNIKIWQMNVIDKKELLHLSNTVFERQSKYLKEHCSISWKAAGKNGQGEKFTSNDISKIYDALDTDRNGCLEQEEVIRWMIDSFEQTGTPETIRKEHNLLDAKLGHKLLSLSFALKNMYNEKYSKTKTNDKHQKMKELLQEFHWSKCVISKAGLRKLANSCVELVSPTKKSMFTSDDIQELMDLHDDDHNGLFEDSEFFKWMGDLMKNGIINNKGQEAKAGQNALNKKVAVFGKAVYQLLLSQYR
eukprot:g3255.t1